MLLLFKYLALHYILIFQIAFFFQAHTINLFEEFTI
jgi:hypothetical protein